MFCTGSFEYENMQYVADRRKDGAGEPPLKDMVTKAIKILRKNKNGYFLLVEGKV